MREAPYDAEKVLQDLVASHPEMLAGDDADGRAAWLLIKQEASIVDEPEGMGRWWVDHLFVDQHGIPTLVEVKRGSDSRIRREVVGQMLDYAANAVVYWPVDHLKAEFEIRCQASRKNADDEISLLLSGEKDAATFWQEAKTNLQAGR